MKFASTLPNGDASTLMRQSSWIGIKLEIDPVKTIWPALRRSPRFRTTSISHLSDE
jgi:hypothetical protein